MRLIGNFPELKKAQKKKKKKSLLYIVSKNGQAMVIKKRCVS